MIRDPSDGSVREKPSEAGIPVSKPIASGLREASPKDKYQARLQASREWLKDYHHRKEVTNDVVRSGNESELPSQG